MANISMTALVAAEMARKQARLREALLSDAFDQEGSSPVATALRVAMWKQLGVV